ncbi:patatin-like phospholipase family protein [Chitinophaga solisilvae]|uniref:patatin-like phospholipase family protein n=1 Tax=Chitinophaga solisilvae TaxID=1233460 RepID=UPI001367F8A0|nr:patatin-like phospholipase family protein [Chitinophaga solisilvae]
MLPYFKQALRFTSHLLKSFWLFFPGIFYLLLIMFASWTLDQGKDVIVAFTENVYRIRIVFFLAIGFWVYVSWYSSRIVAYTKRARQIMDLQQFAEMPANKATLTYTANNRYFNISQSFLDQFPRMMGHCCFLMLELAILQSPALYHPVSFLQAWIIFAVALTALFFTDRPLSNIAVQPWFQLLFYMLLTAWLIITFATGFIPHTGIMLLFVLLLGLHVVFTVYIHLRQFKLAEDSMKPQLNTRTLLDIVMDFFHIPRAEKAFFRWFNITGVAALIVYFAAIQSLDFARKIGPFPYLVLAFGMLLGFGNIITALSVRYRISFHFILLVIALIFGIKETHYVKLTPATAGNNYNERPSLDTYLRAWLRSRPVAKDSAYDVYFVMANGGASRSAYWTAAVLGSIEDASIRQHPGDRFSRHLFCLSGTSGGGVGMAAYFALLRDKSQQQPLYARSAMAYLRQDYFSYTFARMLGPDYFRYIVRTSRAADRAAALEESFEKSTDIAGDSLYRVPFDNAMSSFPAMRGDTAFMPVLCINTTRMQDGNPGLVSNLRLDSGIFNNRVDVLSLLRHDSDITITSGAILGARFPYLSPAGRIQDQYFVDGGYFDNSGAGVIQEIIRGIINIGEDDRHRYGDTSALYQQISRLHFKVIHITNSRVIPKSNQFRKIAPVNNDLFAPLLTIAGAYGMQTTVNDIRLQHYVSDINDYYYKRASYVQIPLYKDSAEWQSDPLRQRFPKGEPSYTMNWFMSDTTIRRINNRLQHNRHLQQLLQEMK